MSLIDRYIAEVGRHLPEKDRVDIEAEIHSTIEDMIEERRHSTASPADEKIIAESLEKLGDPQLLASRYAPPRRYLIGPDWYDVYMKTLRRVLYTVLSVFAAVTFIITLAGSPLDFINAFGKAVGGAFNVGVQIWFWITLVFVLMEHSDAIPNESLATSSGAWTVAQLPELPRKRQISIAETVTNIAFILIIMMITLPAFLTRFQGDNEPLTFLDPKLWNFWLPLFFVIMGLTLIHDVFQLKIGNWTRPLMVTNVILGFSSIVYIAALVSTQNVINPAFLAAIENGMTSSEMQSAATWSAWTVNITAIVIIGIYVWDIVESIRLAKTFEKQKK